MSVYCGCTYPHSETSAHEDMAIDNNATWSNAFQFGTPTDTTWSFNGCTFAADVQLTYYDATPKLSVSSAAGTIVIDDPNQRVLHFSVAPLAIQNALLPGAYVYDLIMTDAMGIKTALMHGCLTVVQGVTGV